MRSSRGSAATGRFPDLPKYVLDTNIVAWLLAGDPRVPLAVGLGARHGCCLRRRAKIGRLRPGARNLRNRTNMGT